MEFFQRRLKAGDISPERIVDQVNELLPMQRFLRQWKSARVVHIPNGKLENPESTSFYRPIYMLDAMAKL